MRSLGLRRANVTGLQWTQVDLVRRLAWMHPDQAKARKAIAVPLNAEAVHHRRRSGSTRRTCSAFGGADSAGQHQSLVQALNAPDRGFSVARPTAHLGELARAERHAAIRVAGIGGLGESGDGAALRALLGRALSALCGSPVRFAGCGSVGKLTAQFRHSPQNEKG